MELPTLQLKIYQTAAETEKSLVNEEEAHAFPSN